MGIILQPFAWLLLFFYNLFSSYGLALILFGIVVKLVLFPVTLKSKKSMIQTTMLSGKMQQLQKQYGKDRERYNLELQKLYEKEKINPMGGCVWSLIPIPGCFPWPSPPSRARCWPLRWTGRPWLWPMAGSLRGLWTSSSRAWRKRWPAAS